jgi:formate--tetrahydrofolate ligase
MTDIDIARKAKIKPITEISQKLGIPEKDLYLFGNDKAKLSLNLINHDNIRASKLILVSAISPTPAGEGKTTVSIGLTEGMNLIGKKTTVVLREPSLGPVLE